MDAKTCGTCNRVLPVEAFYIARGKPCSICRKCEYQRVKSGAYYNSQKRKDNIRKRNDAIRVMITEYKMQRGCCKCGYKNHPAALEFHHLDKATKTKKLTHTVNNSPAFVKTELDKCVVLCANCHRIETAKQNNWFFGVR